MPTFVSAYKARVKAVSDDNETHELVAAVRAGFQVNILEFTATERRGLLEEYNRQDKAAYDAAKGSS